MEQKQSNSMDVGAIMSVLPHRYPMLMVDKVIELKEHSIIAVKNVSINESFFHGHFPGHPVMPGVLIVEAMAQAAGVLVMSSSPGIAPEENVVYFMSIEEAQFRKPVVPGDVLHLHVEKVKNRGNMWKMKGEAKVDGQRVANAVFSAMVMQKR